MRPILLLELNEVHWPVLDRIAARHGRLAGWLARARSHTTIVSPETRLSPWITWPTLHRGLRASEHGITHLGQDPLTGHGTPLWVECRQRGGSIGIVGALHSWPPGDPGPDGFHVPDTFAASAACWPPELEPLQAMNLALTRESGRVASRRVPMRQALAALPVALRLRLPPYVASRAARQLVAERLDLDRRDARPLVQATLFWNVFRRLYARAGRPLAYASFFTNHVASVLHRHWREAFPEELAPRISSRVHRDTVERAFDLLAEIVVDALALAQAHPDLLLVLASSMGQAAVHRGAHHGRELAIGDLARLLALAGIPPEAHAPGIAMVPQATTRVGDPALRARVRQELHALRTISGKRFLDVEVRGESVSVTIGTPPRGDVDSGVLVEHSGAHVRFEDAGIVVHEVARGTGNHVPQGALALAGRGIAPDASRSEIPLESVKGLLLELAEHPS